MKEILITSSVLIIALLVLRMVFGKKVRRTLIYAAWALVALRLLIPVQIGQLDFSVLTAAKPLTETVTEISGLRLIGQNEREAETQVILDYIERDQTVFNPETQALIQDALERNEAKEEIATHISKTQSPENTFIPEAQQQVVERVVEQTNYISIGQVATVVWLVGVAGMAVWFAIVNLRHSRLLRQTRQSLECNSPLPVYVSDMVGSPCLMGLFRPAIYLTPESAAKEETRRHVLTHELTHYAHKDHIWSVVRCLCLCVYWFDPLVWAAAWGSRRDCELACDEGALRRLGEAERIAYGKSLLEVVRQASAPANLIQTATAMNETKKQLKERVDFIVKKPKLSLVAAICMALVCAIVAGCAAAGPTTGAQGGEENSTTIPTEPSQSTPLEPQDSAELLAMIPEETQAQIKKDFLAQFCADDTRPPKLKNLSLRVFGVFGDTYALFVDGAFGYLEAICRGTFGLVYPDSQNMYVYHEGRFYCNLEAESILSAQERAQVVANYYAVYVYLKPLEDDLPVVVPGTPVSTVPVAQDSAELLAMIPEET